VNRCIVWFYHLTVSPFLHKPSTPSGHGLVLTHGAGANAQAPLLIRVAEAFAEAGWYVLRYNLPFRQRKPFGPPSPAGAAADREGLRSAVAEVKQMAERVCLGGHSYGGRQASILAAESPGLVEALLLLSYPLHPPKKPLQLRTAHFPQLHTPALFVSGTKDEFGTVDEMRAALALIPARTELQIVEGAGHDLKKGAFNLQDQIVTALGALVARRHAQRPTPS
jgi:predicted alpha/beta-hydrolase family hydrolase